MLDISLWAAFSDGLLSFVLPCVLPLVPVYLASLCGPEIFGPEARKKRIPIFFHSLSFVIGFSIIFIALGAGAGLLGFVISPYSIVVRRVVGSLLIVFGLFMLAALKLPWLNYERRLTKSLSNATSYLRSFIIGAVFPVAWIPCTSWVLGGILALALASETAWHGAYLLAIYSLGLGLPFLIIGAAFDFINPLLRRIYRYTNWLYIAGGTLLIGMGIHVLTSGLKWLSPVLIVMLFALAAGLLLIICLAVEKWAWERGY